MSRPRASGSSLAAIFVLLVLAPASSRAQEQPAPRQPATFPFDAGTVSRSWFDFSLAYRETDDSSVSRDGHGVGLDGRLAWALGERGEFGFAGSFLWMNYEDPRLGSPSGPSDTLSWLKYRFPSAGTTVVTIGAFASVPTGDKEEFLGTGNLDGGAFLAGGVRTQGGGFVQAHVGVRSNGDFENRLVSHLDGKTSIFAGFGGSYEAASGVEVFSSLLLETNRYEDAHDTALLTGGARWTLSASWRLQVLGSIGLTDAAPRLSLGAGAVWAR